LDIWVGELGSPCGVADSIESGQITILDCEGVFHWAGGRYRSEGGTWEPIPGGNYTAIPFVAGHVEVELPPGCYAAIGGWVSPTAQYIHFNYATHMGLVNIRCDEKACVKLFNPSVQFCFDEFFHALRALAVQGRVDGKRVLELRAQVAELIADAPRFPVEEAVIKAHAALFGGDNR